MQTFQTSHVGTQSKMTGWANEPSLQILKQDFESSKPAHDLQQGKIDNWVNQLQVKGKAKPVKVKGRSAVQPKLIRRQAEWRYSALSEPFLGTKKLYSVSPATFEDEFAAKQNELVINHQFRTKLNKVNFIDSYVRATVDEGTSIVRVGWKRHTKTVKKTVPVWEHYEMRVEEEAAILQSALEMAESNPRIYDEQTAPAVKAAVDYYRESGTATTAVQVGERVVTEELVIENRPDLELMNPANVYIDPSCGGDFSKAMFVIFSFETSRAELQKETGRYRNLDRVNWEGNSPMTDSDHQTSTPSDFGFNDAARKRVVAYEYWGFFDVEGDGNLVPFVATWIGDTVIRMEENPFPDEKLPVVVTTYLPVKREVYGEPDAEMLEDNQAILGAVSRGMIDSMGRSANGQQGFARGMLDPLNRRRFDNGEDYEFNPNLTPNAGVIDHTYPELPQSAMLMLQLQNQEAEALTGVKSFSGGLSGSSYGDVATGIRGVLDAASKREMSILRRLVSGIVDIGNKIIAMNSAFLSEKEVVRITNSKFVTVKREDLKGNFDLTVDISTAEVDEAKAQDLGFMLQTLGPNMDPSITMTILAEIAALKQMPVLAENLRTWKPQPDPVAEEMKQMELEKMRLELAVLQSEVALNQARAQKDLAIVDQANLDFVEQESGTKHAREVDKQKAQARGNQSLEITKAMTKATKEGEKRPDLEAAVGYNRISDILND